MASEAEKLHATKNQERIPAPWQLEFESWADDSLLSLADDAMISGTKRAWAKWMLEYRTILDRPEPKQALIDVSRYWMKTAKGRQFMGKQTKKEQTA